MTYNRLDIIPLKIFLEVYNTENLTLLTDNKKDLISIREVWKQMKAEYELLGLSGNANKLLKLVSRIEALKVKYDSIGFALTALRFDEDIDLMAKLNSYGYTINKKTYFQDIDRIDRESQSITLKIKRLEQKLPKKDENEKKTTIDRVILGYCAISGLNFDTNKITVIQFHSLKELAEEKIKQLEAANASSKSKK